MSAPPGSAIVTRQPAYVPAHRKAGPDGAAFLAYPDGMGAAQAADDWWGGTMKQTTRAPNLTHAEAAATCHMALQTMDLNIKRVTDYRDGYDFLVEDKIRIAVRYAIPTSDRQQVYRKRNGDVSHYSYKRWTFNFHRHGKRPERYCDFFVCFLAAVPNGSSSPAADVTVFTIPWEAITGLTFCSSVRQGSTRPYRGKYAVYRDGWDLISAAANGSEAPADQKRLRISSDRRRKLRLVVGGEAAAPTEQKQDGPVRRPSLGPIGHPHLRPE